MSKRRFRLAQEQLECEIDHEIVKAEEEAALDERIDQLATELDAEAESRSNTRLQE